MEKKAFLQSIRLDNANELSNSQGHPVLVALSGGADSVALLRVLLEMGVECRAVHCNFHLRGDESMRDEQFVRDLCLQLGVPLSVKDFDVAGYQLENGGSVEMACRDLRYAWFEQELEHQACRFIAVAHHADDQVETFFLNLLRGTGAKGLAGMKRLNGHVWRPLLNVSREDILSYLDSIGQNYVNDSTNAANDYRRNRLRNIILPLISEQFPNARERILDTMRNLSCDHELLTRLVEDTIPDDREIDFKGLCDHPSAPTLLYHRIRHLGFNRDQCTQAIEAARRGHTGRQFAADSHLLVVNRQNLTIQPLEAPIDPEIPLDLNAGIKGPIRLDVSRGNEPFSPQMCNGKTIVAFNTQLLDCKRIVLRHWRRGDRIHPFGMRGSKLVSDLFVDLKLDHAAKQAVGLLEADGEIIWVVGLRSTRHYPVTTGSQDYLILTQIMD